MKKLLIMAGGTGGHIYPAMAVAEHLRQKGWHVEWLGAVRGLENEIVPKSQIPLHVLSISGLRGKGILGYCLLPWRLGKAVYQAVTLLRRLQPNVVLGMGGFASGPGGLASYLCRIPLIVHEQNALPGMTNKCLARLASKVLQAFPNALGHHAITTGNPIRAAISSKTARSAPLDTLRVLVIGGSQGARAINSVLPQVIAENSEIEVLHQTGKNLYQETIDAYQQQGIEQGSNIRVQPYLEDMQAAYHWADVVISRAGALSVSEIAMVGIPSILVPFPFAVDDHQTKNAQYLVDSGAAYLLPQTELTVDTLSRILLELHQKPEKLNAMSHAAIQCATPDATAQVAQHVEALL